MTTHVLWVLVHCAGARGVRQPLRRRVSCRVVRGKNWDETVDDFEPTVTAVIPMFNEGKAIQETLQSLLDSDYPARKAARSSASTTARPTTATSMAREIARKSGGRLHRHPQPRQPRQAPLDHPRRARVPTARSSSRSTPTSSSTRTPSASSCRRFTSPRIAAVGGWVDVRNKQDNWLTRMQVVKYWYAYLLHEEPRVGLPPRDVPVGLPHRVSPRRARRARAGAREPRDPRRADQVRRGPLPDPPDRQGRLPHDDDARRRAAGRSCRTRCRAYFSQQLRWRRSNIVDYAGGFSHVWRLNPILAIHFFSLFALLIVYPIAVVRALASHRFFPALAAPHRAWSSLFGVYLSLARAQAAEGGARRRARVRAAALLMPITYALLTPLALFTLDSGSWETRGHEDAEPDAAPADRRASPTWSEPVRSSQRPVASPSRPTPASRRGLTPNYLLRRPEFLE